MCDKLREKLLVVRVHHRANGRTPDSISPMRLARAAGGIGSQVPSPMGEPINSAGRGIGEILVKRVP